MKKTNRNNECLVQGNREVRKPEETNLSVVLRHDNGYGLRVEKLWLVGYFTVRRRSRTLYLPLDPTAVRLHDIQKGDIVKAVLLEVRKAPRPNEPLRVAENEPTDEGELT